MAPETIAAPLALISQRRVRSISSLIGDLPRMVPAARSALRGPRGRSNPGPLAQGALDCFAASRLAMTSQVTVAQAKIRAYPHAPAHEVTMSRSPTWKAASSRRSFLKNAAGATAGTVLTGQQLWAQGSRLAAATPAAQPQRFAKIDPKL